MIRQSGFGRWLTAFSFLAVILLDGCGSRNPLQEMDTPTTGRMKVGIDESYRLMMEAQIYAFESFYMYARIDTLFGAEADIINAFLKDSIPLMIVNRQPFTDAGFVILRNDPSLTPPMAVVNYEFYDNPQTPEKETEGLKNLLQCVTGHGYIPYGNSQKPELWDYADNVDTISFLLKKKLIR